MAYAIPLWTPPALPVTGSKDQFPVRRIFCVGRNYAEHQKEMGGDGRETPFFFLKSEFALVVRGADTARLELAPQAPGLAAISLGLSRNFVDDHEMLKHGMVMYDALYAWCKEGRDELHTWNPAAYV